MNEMLSEVVEFNWLGQLERVHRLAEELALELLEGERDERAFYAEGTAYGALVH